MKKGRRNSQGFSHHIIFPVLAFLLVAGIGSYVMLRSSSARSYIDCNGRTIGKSVVNCSYVSKGGTLKKHNLYYDLHWQRTSKEYKYLKVALISTTQRYANEKTIVKISPLVWSVNCFNSKDISTFETKRYYSKGGTVRIPRKYVRCGINVSFNYYQYGPIDGYVYKSVSGISQSVYLK